MCYQPVALMYWGQLLCEAPGVSFAVFGLNCPVHYGKVVTPPIKNNQLWSVRSQCTLVVESWNFLCSFQNGMALFGNFSGPLHYVLHGEKIWNATFAGLHQSRLVPKIHKKLNKNCHKICVVQSSKNGWKGFFSQSENHFLHIPADILVSFPVNILFWSLSLSPAWLNIEGWQDFSY